MSDFFDIFPKILYDIDGTGKSKYDQPTNIMVRIGVIAETLTNIFHYYNYTVRETETPEIVAENYYGNPELHWLVLLTNQMLDPQFDWPLDSRAFNNYIIGKYGSIATAQTTYHHWSRILETIDNATGLSTIHEIRFVDQDGYDDSALPTDRGSPSIYTVNNVNNSVVSIYEYKTRTLAYDWEVEQNFAKRNIKLIKTDYLPLITSQFQSIIDLANGPDKVQRSLFLRKIN